jgi:hypothetical protein
MCDCCNICDGDAASNSPKSSSDHKSSTSVSAVLFDPVGDDFCAGCLLPRFHLPSRCNLLRTAKYACGFLCHSDMCTGVCDNGPVHI